MNKYPSRLKLDAAISFEIRAAASQQQVSFTKLATSTNELVRQLGSEIAGIRCALTAMRDRQSNEERAHTVLVESSKTDHERIWKAIDELKDQA